MYQVLKINLIQRLSVNLQNYFNFGFTLNYFLFLCKIEIVATTAINLRQTQTVLGQITNEIQFRPNAWRCVRFMEASHFRN